MPPKAGQAGQFDLQHAEELLQRHFGRNLAELGISGIRQEKGLSRLISSFFERQDARERVLVNKKKLMWVAFLLGWCGGHRFMLKQKWVGLLYLAFCWTSFPIAMTIVDFLQYIPMKPDENGNILV